ncbi:MAG: hypothetical protein M3522_12475, partial [Actinomycetota bacterium]|nr:hypothetical protein [Actinomycetota bacterium]
LRDRSAWKSAKRQRKVTQARSARIDRAAKQRRKSYVSGKAKQRRKDYLKTARTADPRTRVATRASRNSARSLYPDRSGKLRSDPARAARDSASRVRVPIGLEKKKEPPKKERGVLSEIVGIAGGLGKLAKLGADVKSGKAIVDAASGWGGGKGDKPVQSAKELAAIPGAAWKAAKSQASEVQKELAKPNQTQALNENDRLGGVKAVGKQLGAVGNLSAGGAANLATAPLEVIRAWGEKKGQTTGATIASVPKIIAGAVPGVVGAANDPARAIGEMTKDYKERYGPLARGDRAAFRKGVQERGAIPYLLDFNAAGAVSGRAVGAAERASRGAVKSPAKPRPPLKVTEGIRKPRPTSKRAGRALRQKGLDRLSQARSRSRVSRGVGRSVESARRVRGEDGRNVMETKRRYDTRRDFGRVRTREKTEDEDVTVPLTAVGARSRQRLEESTLRARSLVATRTAQGRERKKAKAVVLRGLKKPEQIALPLILQHGFPESEAAAKTLLDTRETNIIAGRKKWEDEHPGQTFEEPAQFIDDELKIVQEMKKNIGAWHTPKLKEAVAKTQKQEELTSDENAGMTADQRLFARADVQGRYLKVEHRKGETNKEYRRRVKSETRRAEARLVKKERQAAREQGGAEVRVEQADRAALRESEGYRAAAKEMSKAQRELQAARARQRNTERAPSVYGTREKNYAPEKVEQARAKVTAARAKLKIEAAAAAGAPAVHVKSNAFPVGERIYDPVNGVRARGKPISPDDKRIPDEVFHVTTNLPAVQES